MVSKSKGQKKMNIIEQLEKQFEELQKQDETKEEKKSYSEMTDAEKLKVKTEQLKKEKAKNKELQKKIEFYQNWIENATKNSQPKKVENVPPQR